MGWGSIQNRILLHPRGPWLPTLSTSVVTFKSYSAGSFESNVPQKWHINHLQPFPQSFVTSNGSRWCFLPAKNVPGGSPHQLLCLLHRSLLAPTKTDERERERAEATTVWSLPPKPTAAPLQTKKTSQERSAGQKEGWSKKQIVKKVQKFDEPRTKILNPSHRVFFLLRNHLESFMTYILDLVYIYWYSFKSKPAEQISWKKWISS